MAQFHVLIGPDDATSLPAIRRIGLADLRAALRSGLDDFLAIPTHAVFLCLIYPIASIVLAGLTLGYDVLPLLFPLTAGFALLGPFAAVHLYELSRRREAGLDVSWSQGFDVLRSSSLPAIAVVGIALMALFLAWLYSARAIYQSLFGVLAPESATRFLIDVFTTPNGWKLILIGNAVGFVFAVVAFTISVVSFPMLLDRNVGAAVAILTSMRAVAANPITMAAWGLIVAALLVIGCLPVFVGLAVVMPVLGHSTWHLYRRVVAS